MECYLWRHLPWQTRLRWAHPYEMEAAYYLGKGIKGIYNIRAGWGCAFTRLKETDQ